jgi:predicted Zn-dependent protease with MMP-like domain
VISRRFARLVFKVLSELPDPFRQSLANVDIVVKRRPGPADRRYAGAKRGDRLYGLYEGVPLGERGSSYSLVPPDKITLFREPLERDFPDERELAEEIRKTVLHEIAHFFGMSEESVADLGID